MRASAIAPIPQDMSTIFPPALECTGIVELSLPDFLFVILAEVRRQARDDEDGDSSGFDIVDVLFSPCFSETIVVLGAFEVKPCCDEVEGNHQMVEVYSPCEFDDVRIVAGPS